MHFRAPPAVPARLRAHAALPVRLLALAAVAIAGCSGPGERSPEAEPAAESGPAGDLANLGVGDSILSWTPAQQLAGYRNFDRVYPTRPVPAGDDPYPLPERPRDLSALRYTVGGDTFGLEDFIEHNRVVGLLVLEQGAVAYERYERGNTPETRWVSFSIAKSVVSLLVGAAIRDGWIGSVDDPVTDYVRVVRGTSYEGVTIRDALHMASGVAWNEDYADPDADVSRQPRPTLEALAYLGRQPRVAPPGTRFNYNTGETHLVGSVLRSAIGNNLATYLAHEIWQPFGMEHDAYWMTMEEGGAEHGGCCLSATLRDYGRLGLFAMHGGVLRDGSAVLPDGWMEAATTPSPANDGYGYLWWLGGGGEGTYAGLGIYGQLLFVDPDDDVIVVTHSTWPAAVGEEWQSHRWAFVRAVVEALR